MEEKRTKYNGLQLDSRVLEEMGHSGSKAEAYARGLEFIYKRPVTDLPQKELEQYSGKYRDNFGDTISIESGDGYLIMKSGTGWIMNWQDKKIYPLTDSTFCWERNYNDFHFTRNASNKVNGYQMYLYGNTISARRTR